MMEHRMNFQVGTESTTMGIDRAPILGSENMATRYGGQAREGHPRAMGISGRDGPRLQHDEGSVRIVVRRVVW